MISDRNLLRTEFCVFNTIQWDTLLIFSAIVIRCAMYVNSINYFSFKKVEQLHIRIPYSDMYAVHFVIILLRHFTSFRLAFILLILSVCSIYFPSIVIENPRKFPFFQQRTIKSPVISSQNLCFEWNNPKIRTDSLKKIGNPIISIFSLINRFEIHLE